MRGEPVVAEAGVPLQQPEAHSVFSRGSFPWITGPVAGCTGSGRGGVDRIVTCACTQASWWLQQQP